MSESTDNESYSKLNALSALMSSEDAEFKDIEAKLQVKQREIVRQSELHKDQIKIAEAQQKKMGQLHDTMEQELIALSTQLLRVQDLSKILAVRDRTENDALLSSLVAGFRSVTFLEQVSCKRGGEITDYLEDNASIKDFRELMYKLQEAIGDSQGQLDSINQSLENVQERAREASNKKALIMRETETLESNKRALIDEIGELKEEEQARETHRSMTSMQEELTDIQNTTTSVTATLVKTEAAVQELRKVLATRQSTVKANVKAGEERLEAELALDVSIDSLQKDAEATNAHIKSATASLTALRTDIAASNARNAQVATRLKDTSATIESMSYAGAQVNSHIADLKQQIGRTTGDCQHQHNSNNDNDNATADSLSSASSLSDQSDPRRELRHIEAEVQAVEQRCGALEEDRATKLAAIDNDSKSHESAKTTLDSLTTTIDRVQGEVTDLEIAMQTMLDRELSDSDMDTFLQSGELGDLDNGTSDSLATLLGFGSQGHSQGSVMENKDEETLVAAIVANKDAIVQCMLTCRNLANEKQSRKQALDRMTECVTSREAEIISLKVEKDVEDEVERNRVIFQETLTKLDTEIDAADKEFRESFRRLEDQNAVTEESFQGEYRAKLKELQTLKMKAILGASQPTSQSQQQG